MKRLLAWLRAYGANDDPALAAANSLALLLGSNGPVYPLYLWALLGRPGLHAGLMTMGAMPFFLAVPALGRRHKLAARLLLAATSTANTVWCLKLLGPASGVGLFLLPCVLVAGYLFRASERVWLAGAAAVPALALAVGPGFYAPALAHFDAAGLARLAAMHRLSVAGLMLVMVWTQAGMLRRTAGLARG